MAAAAAEVAQMGLWYWNEVTTELFWDKKTREMFGVNLVGEVTVDTFYGALHPDDLARVKEIWRYELERGLPYELEYRALRPDGSICWIEARGRSYLDRDGTPLSMVGVVFDVTERHRAQEALRASEERLRLSQQIAHIGSFDWNIQTGVNTWTPELEAMYGLHPGGFSRTQMSFENLVHGDDREAVIKLVDRALKTGRQRRGNGGRSCRTGVFIG